ncbi:MAG TPA: apolipoprotein N-acyltransferase [Burkholderiales bacterium]|nr:apolipoprotein N-acyltransferase [Burkholderiales bacterium]
MKAEGGRRKDSIAAAQALVTRHPSLLTAFILGAVTVFGYAPFYLYPLPVLTLAGLFYLWAGAPGSRAAAALGFAFGLGLFLAGVSWIYVSLHDFGAMPLPVAAVTTFLFCAFLALFPAAVGAICARIVLSPVVRWVLLAPSLWALMEWTRSWIFTGFPWLALGYSQIPGSPLAGFAPVFGTLGVTLATAASAGLVVMLTRAAKSEGARRKAEEKNRVSGKSSFIRHPSSFIPAAVLVALWVGGWGLKQISWTQPLGAPLTVSVLQGNVPQDTKWREDRIAASLDIYASLIRKTSSRLVILPETALPVFLDQVSPDYLGALTTHARAHGGDILVGVPERLPDGQYFNSVVSYGTAPTQTYRKSHLVPFGEFIPLRPVLGGIVAALAIPLQDFSRGGERQRPLAVGGQKVAVNICYEDAFGEEIIRQLPEATLLVNASNVAWFGRSLAPRQHLQISQARALETGRYLVRATNTGVTGVIAPDGTVVATAPEFTKASLTQSVQGYGGATPYVRWGNYAALLVCVVLIGLSLLTQRVRARSAS